jgi:hypothetical protein
MGRERIYLTAAERQKAYRERATLNRGHPSGPASPKRNRPPSRPKRLAAIERELRILVTEYETWLANLPESLEGSEQADLLAEAIERLTDATDLIADVTLPLGFGRD